MKDWGIRPGRLLSTSSSARSCSTALLVLLVRGRLRAADRVARTSRTCCSRARRRGRRKSRCAPRSARAAAGCCGSCSSRASCCPSIGGAAGLLAALVGGRRDQRVVPPNLLPVPDVRIDATVLLFALGATTSSPAALRHRAGMASAHADLNEVLKQATRSSGGARPRLRNGLAAAELALATVLLIGAALLLQDALPAAARPSGLRGARSAHVPGRTAGSALSAGQPRAAFYRSLVDSLQGVSVRPKPVTDSAAGTPRCVWPPSTGRPNASAPAFTPRRIAST